MTSLIVYKSAPLALRHCTALAEEAKAIDTSAHAEAIIREAKAYQAAFADIDGIKKQAGLAWVFAERTMGKARAAMPKPKGGRPGKKPVPAETQVLEPPTRDEIGLSGKRSASMQKLADLGVDEIEHIAEELSTSGKAVSPSTVLSAKRSKTKVEKVHAVATARFSADGPFGTVVIDPPWQVEKIDRNVRPNQDAFDYPTMTTDQITSFVSNEIIPKTLPDCHLFMWTTHKWLPPALEIIRATGFRYVLTMVWHKPGGFQPVGLPQYNCEFIVYARRGTPLFIDTKDFPCCFTAERREHSRKPDRFYEIVRRVTGGSRIDVFSRESRDGFAQYGNELERFQGAA